MRQQRTGVIIGGIVFVLLFIAIIFFWFNITGKQLLHIVDSGPDDAEEQALEQLKEDLGSFGETFNEATDSFQKQKAYLKQKTEEEAAQAALYSTSTDALSPEVIEQLKLKIEESYSTSTEQ